MDTIVSVYVSVYLPVKGWAMVVYGPEGPEYTGMGGSLASALHDAINESNETGYELQVQNLYICPVCNGVAMQYNKCDCGYMPQSYIDKQHEWDVALAKINPKELHNNLLDQKIFGYGA